MPRNATAKRVATSLEEIERVDRAEAIEGIRKGLADVQHARTRPVRKAIEDFRRKYEVCR